MIARPAQRLVTEPPASKSQVMENVSLSGAGCKRLSDDGLSMPVCQLSKGRQFWSSSQRLVTEPPASKSPKSWRA
jgi:hypothetical protein